MTNLFVGWVVAVVVVCGGFTVLHAVCPSCLGDAPPPYWKHIVE